MDTFLVRLGISTFFAMNVMLINWTLYADKLSFLFIPDAVSIPFLHLAALVLSLPVMIVLGIPYASHALVEMKALRPGLDTLIATGTWAAFTESAIVTILWSADLPVYFDTAVMILVLVTFGRYLEAHARQRVAASMGIVAEETHPMVRVLRDGKAFFVPEDEVMPGDLVSVLPGEAVRVDGVLIEGSSSISKSVLTGEAMPVLTQAGEEVLAGSVNGECPIVVRTTHTCQTSYVRRMESLATEAMAHRGQTLRAIDSIARWFTPGILALGVVSGIVTGLRFGPLAGVFQTLSVVLIACPCALGIGANLAACVGYGMALKKGIVIRSFAALERLGRITTVIFDKTGTLTNGVLEVKLLRKASTSGISLSEKDLWGIAGSLAAKSNHPLSRAIARKAVESHAPVISVHGVHEKPGMGIFARALLPGEHECEVSICRADIENLHPEEYIKEDSLRHHLNAGGIASWLTLDNEIRAIILGEDELRPGAREAIGSIRSQGFGVAIASGDQSRRVASVADDLGIDDVRPGMEPHEKLALVGDSSRGRVLMVGEGFNDAPSVGGAEVGMAFGRATDAVKAVADVSVQREDLSLIPWLLWLSRRTLRAIRWNLAWAFGYNAVGVGLALLGFLHPVFSAGIMVVSSLVVVVSSAWLPVREGTAGQENQREKIFGSTAAKSR